MADSATASNFRSPIVAEPNLMPPSSTGGGDIGISSNLGSEAILRTPAGNVRSLAPPPLPMGPTPQYSAGMGGYGGLGGYGAGGLGGYGSSFGGGYGGFGSNYGGGYGGGYGGLGGFGNSFGGYGAGYNRFGIGGGGMNPMDPEARFIQLAEASSRSAFQSIESLVSAIGNIASMLDSTFFALTSSFRAILGVAANFGRLRGVFAQFWSTFAIFRGLSWIYRKILYCLRISDLDPSSESFKKAFAEAMNETSTQHGAPKLPRKGQSPWPVLAFLSFIFTAPYLIMKLLGTVTNIAQEEARNPSKWVKPIVSIALYDFQARNPSELNIHGGQRTLIAPKEIQNTLGLLNTGWALATTDGQTTGIIPINYVKTPQQMRQEQLIKPTLDMQAAQKQPQQQQPQKQQPIQQLQQQQFISPEYSHENSDGGDIIGAPQPDLMNLSTSAFASPPIHTQMDPMIADFDIAPQPLGPPNTLDVALENSF